MDRASHQQSHQSSRGLEREASGRWACSGKSTCLSMLYGVLATNAADQTQVCTVQASTTTGASNTAHPISTNTGFGSSPDTNYSSHTGTAATGTTGYSAQAGSGYAPADASATHGHGTKVPITFVQPLPLCCAPSSAIVLDSIGPCTVPELAMLDCLLRKVACLPFDCFHVCCSITHGRCCMIEHATGQSAHLANHVAILHIQHHA